jgi:hypothetical protein
MALLDPDMNLARCIPTEDGNWLKVGLVGLNDDGLWFMLNLALLYTGGVNGRRL